MFFRKINKLLRRKPQVQQNQHKTPLDILIESGKFNAEWYKAAYPDIAAHPYWANNLLSHYLTIGGFEGKNPAPWFDSAWYLQHYSDVKAANINPLLHYVMYGSSENRAPNPGQPDDSIKTMQQSKGSKNDHSGLRDKIKNLIDHLWAGHSISALAELKAIYSNQSIQSSVRAVALWNVIRWVYFSGDTQQVLSLTALLTELDTKNNLLKERALILSFCHFASGTASDAIPLIEHLMEQKPDDIDSYFVLANCYMNDDQLRLSIINQAFAKAGLSAIDKIQQAQPLGISNIKGYSAGSVIRSEKVSIIMPVYNAEHCLQTAVNSLLQQSWQNIEVIIVDDCSSDQTFQLAQKLAASDSRVIALRQDLNSGAYPARNFGLKHATGDFITTHDADDWSHPQKIETQLKCFEQNENLQGLCTYWIRTKHNLFFTQNWRPHNALTHWSHSSFIFRKKVAERLGGWDEVRVGGDTEYIWRLKTYFGQHSYQQFRADIPLAFALDDENSLTRTKNTHVKTVYFGLRHIYREISAYRHKTRGRLQIVKGTQNQSNCLPVSIVHRDNRAVELDILFISDFADPVKTEQIEQFIQSLSDGYNIGLFHWPHFNANVTPLADRYFDMLNRGAIPVVSGEYVTTQKVLLLDHQLIQHTLDELPNIKAGAEYVLISENSDIIEAKNLLRTIFQQSELITINHSLKELNV